MRPRSRALVGSPAFTHRHVPRAYCEQMCRSVGVCGSSWVRVRFVRPRGPLRSRCRSSDYYVAACRRPVGRWTNSDHAVRQWLTHGAARREALPTWRHGPERHPARRPLPLRRRICSTARRASDCVRVRALPRGGPISEVCIAPRHGSRASTELPPSRSGAHVVPARLCLEGAAAAARTRSFRRVLVTCTTPRSPQARVGSSYGPAPQVAQRGCMTRPLPS